METLQENKPKSLPDIARELIKTLGEDPARPGLKRTPERFAKAISELLSGYSQDIDAIINGAVYQSHDNGGLIVVRDIGFYSLCEHHLLPFHGKVHVAYYPGEKIIGLSKIPRIVGVFSHRLQLQERLTNQIARALQEKLEPQGVAVVARARHMCLEMRGAKMHTSEMVTSAYLGKLRDDPGVRGEFLSLIQPSLLR